MDVLDEVESYSCINTKSTWINGMFTRGHDFRQSRISEREK